MVAGSSQSDARAKGDMSGIGLKRQMEKVVQRQRITGLIQKTLISNIDTGFDGAHRNPCRGAEAVSCAAAGQTRRIVIEPQSQSQRHRNATHLEEAWKPHFQY